MYHILIAMVGKITTHQIYHTLKMGEFLLYINNTSISFIFK
jgi:hypothetical protein